MIMSHLLRFLQPFQPSTCFHPEVCAPSTIDTCKASGNVLSISSELQASGSFLVNPSEKIPISLSTGGFFVCAYKRVYKCINT